MGHREISAELLAKGREGSYFSKYFATHGIVDTLGMLLLVRPAFASERTSNTYRRAPFRACPSG